MNVLIASDDHRLHVQSREWLTRAFGGPPAHACDLGTLLGALAAMQLPVLLVLDDALVRCPLRDMLLRLFRESAGLRVLLLCDALCIENVVRAIAAGAHGLLARTAGRDHWLRALTVVARGELWLPRQLLAEALSCTVGVPDLSRPSSAPVDGLTARQREIVDCVALGLSNKEIGRQLHISPATVKTHLQNIYSQTGAHGRMPLLSGRRDRQQTARASAHSCSADTSALVGAAVTRGLPGRAGRLH